MVGLCEGGNEPSGSLKAICNQSNRLPPSGTSRILWQKADMNSIQIKQISLATIAERYPEPDWWRVYNDGSRLEIEENAGAGFYCKEFAHYTP
ncbi:hypothetical protein ANN_13050 [Periplaneta americana]|uniref:Uncharacterized protein n=1 Tax=Periplaneta americana TaxID=6978 RepID=A0ABQ8TIU6_PERAM|nr:hypothetical protein ANN_13050 [Periplaneta americana]